LSRVKLDVSDRAGGGRAGPELSLDQSAEHGADGGAVADRPAVGNEADSDSHH